MGELKCQKDQEHTAVKSVDQKKERENKWEEEYSEPSKRGLKERRRLDKVWVKILNTILRKVLITKKER